jgi:Protein kinase domain/PEGA domain
MPLDAFGPFRVLHQIGAGTLGPVFRAYDSQQERLVAVKLFRLELPPEQLDQLVEDFQRLIDASLVHPAIAASRATGVVGTSAYLAQDFVAADSLDIVIREFGPVSADEAARVALQLAGALDYAAAANVWHGGLHPRDVFLASDEVRLTGLGIAQVLEHMLVPAPVRQPYAAPERVAGGDWDRRADVFSLAVLIAEMIAGRHLSGMGSRAVQGLLGASGVESDSLREVFARALADDPDSRFDTALAFAEALKDAARGVVGEASAQRVLLPETIIEARLPLADPVAFVPEVSVVDDVTVMGEAGDPLSDFDPAGSVPDAVTQVPQVHQVAQSQAYPRPDDRDVKERIKEIDALLLYPGASPPGPTDTDTPTERTDTRLVVPTAPPRPNGEGAARAAAAVADTPLKRPAAPVPAAARPIEDRSQSAVWPLALALLVGLIVGIAVGFYVFADRFGPNPGVAIHEADGGVTSDRRTASPAPSSDAPSLSAAAPNTPPPAAPNTDAAVPGGAGAGRGLTQGGPAAAGTETAPSTGHPPAALPGVTRPTEPPTERARADRAVGRPAIVTDLTPPATEAAGRVLVRSTPAGARVVLDGREVGMTPVTVRALSFGIHVVRITRDGYLDDERQVAVSAKRPAQSLIVELSRVRELRPEGESATARFTAALIVESRPPGAIVFLNGDRVGTTPLTLDTVATGSQALRLEMDGYRRWTSSIRVVAGERNRITASLEQ